jgi:hypothetical protein
MQDAQARKDDALIVPPEDMTVSPPAPTAVERIRTALRKPGEALSGVMQSIKGRDLEGLIEEFTGDVTLVLGGISDDQERLDRENEKLHQQIAALEKRLKELEKKAEARPEKDGLIRRITWLAAVVFGGMALLYIIKFLLS